MEEVLIYIGEHAGGGLEGMICGLESTVFRAVLVRGMT
jgi:hypothetical protein